MRLAHQDHPLGRVAKVGEIRVIALVLNVEVDLEVNEHVPLGQRHALNSDAELLAHERSTAIARQQVAAVTRHFTVGRVQSQLHMVVVLSEAHESVAHVHSARGAAFKFIAQDGL